MLIYKSLSEDDYQKALKNHEFDLAYQPIMNLETDGFETFEAFIRWHHPELGTLPPSIFMNNIEKYGLQEDMTAYIFDLAVDQILQNSRSGYGETGVSINLSLEEFYNPNTFIQLQKSVSRIPFPEFLGIEISPKILTAYNNPDLGNPDPEYHPDSPPSNREIKFLENIQSTVKEYANLGITLALDTTDYVIGGLIRAEMIGVHALKISAKALQTALIKDRSLIDTYAQASKDFQIPLIIVGIENHNLFKIAYNHELFYTQGLFLCPPLCLKKPQEFNDHLTRYHDAKKELLNMQDNIDQLKHTAKKLIKEEVTPHQQDFSQKTEIKHKTLPQEKPKPILEQAPSYHSSDTSSSELKNKHKTGMLDSLDDMFSELNINHTYLEAIDTQNQQPPKIVKQDNAVPSFSSIKKDMITAPKNTSFGKRGQF